MVVNFRIHEISQNTPPDDHGRFIWLLTSGFTRLVKVHVR